MPIFIDANQKFEIDKAWKADVLYLMEFTAYCHYCQLLTPFTHQPQTVAALLSQSTCWQ
jgi:hypothetical protein